MRILEIKKIFYILLLCILFANAVLADTSATSGRYKLRSNLKNELHITGSRVMQGDLDMGGYDVLDGGKGWFTSIDVNNIDVNDVNAVTGTFSGTVTANIFTDGVATLTGGNLTGMGNISGTDIDIEAGTGDYNSTGTLTAGTLIGSDLTSGRVPFITTAGQITDSSMLTYNSTTNLLTQNTGQLSITGTNQATPSQPALAVLYALGGKGGFASGIGTVAGKGSDIGLYGGPGGDASIGATRGGGGNLNLRGGLVGSDAGGAGPTAPTPGKVNIQSVAGDTVISAASVTIDSSGNFLNVGNMTLQADKDITLSGTGHITSGSEGFIVGSLTITDGSINDTDGTIAFGDTNLTGLGELTVGVDADGKDVTFHSTTASERLLWDASESLLNLDGKIDATYTTTLSGSGAAGLLANHYFIGSYDGEITTDPGVAAIFAGVSNTSAFGTTYNQSGGADFTISGLYGQQTWTSDFTVTGTAVGNSLLNQYGLDFRAYHSGDIISGRVVTYDQAGVRAEAGLTSGAVITSNAAKTKTYNISGGIFKVSTLGTAPTFNRHSTEDFTVTYTGGRFLSNPAAAPTAANSPTVRSIGGYFDASLGLAQGDGVSNVYGAYIEAIGDVSDLNTGLYIGAVTGATTNWAIAAAGGDSYHVGDFRIGSAVAPTARLHLAAGTATAGTAPIKFDAGTALTTPETGAIEFHDSRFYITNKSVRKAIDRTSDVKLTTTTVDGDAGADGTTETEVFSASVPAGSWVAGNILKMFMGGDLTNKVASAGHTITIRVKVGGDTVSTLVSTAAKFTDACWHIYGYATVRDVGGTGHMAWHMDMAIDGDNATDSCDVSEIDTTGALDVTVTAQWGTADAANLFNCTMGWMEYKN